MSRLFAGLSMAFIVLFLIYVQQINLLYLMMMAAGIYDMLYMGIVFQVNEFLCAMGLLFLVWFHTHLYFWYAIDPRLVLELAFITQLSDVYQYVSGKMLGTVTIGWISPNKTWSGFLWGYFSTLVTFVLALGINRFKYITMVYWLGVTSGLLSSLIKRYLGLKDYSNLLGSHGGWMDRIDSLVLPAFIMPYLF